MIGVVLGLAIWAAILAAIRALKPRFKSGCVRGCLAAGTVLWFAAVLLAVAFIALMANT